MSSKKTAALGFFEVPVSEFQYRQMIPAAPVPVVVVREEPREPEVRIAESVYYTRLATERERAIAETEARIKQEYEQRHQNESARIGETISRFELSRKEYFSRVEGEVVRLALAIAKKILHREAQAEPILVAAIVQIALGQLKDGSIASLRVRPEETQRWREYFAAQAQDLTVNIVGDADLAVSDCILETELGSVNFGLDAQLKEVEQGFFDVLAQKPQA